MMIVDGNQPTYGPTYDVKMVQLTILVTVNIQRATYHLIVIMALHVLPLHLEQVIMRNWLMNRIQSLIVYPLVPQVKAITTPPMNIYTIMMVHILQILQHTKLVNHPLRVINSGIKRLVLFLTEL